MTKNVKKIIAGGLIATTVAVPSASYIKVNKELGKVTESKQNQAEEFKQHQEELIMVINTQMKQLEEQEAEIITLTQTTKSLQAESDALEGVQQTIIDSVGYYPSTYERKLLERLVECEAGGESMEGKIAVANVVLNRIKAKNFPDSIYKVIYDGYQFEPVVTGVIDVKVASDESVEAVKRAFMGERVVSSDILYFWAKWLRSGHDLWNHLTPAKTIGVHHFAKEWVN